MCLTLSGQCASFPILYLYTRVIARTRARTHFYSRTHSLIHPRTHSHSCAGALALARTCTRVRARTHTLCLVLSLSHTHARARTQYVPRHARAYPFQSHKQRCRELARKRASAPAQVLCLPQRARRLPHAPCSGVQGGLRGEGEERDPRAIMLCRSGL